MRRNLIELEGRLRAAIPAPLLPMLRSTLYWPRYLSDSTFREREKKAAARYRRFTQEWAPLAEPVPRGTATRGRVLILTAGVSDAIEVELSFAKALQYGGYEPVVLGAADRWLDRYYRFSGITTVLNWEQFLPRSSALPALPSPSTFDDVLRLQYEGARIGKYAASWVMRQLRVASFDPADPLVWPHLLAQLRQSQRIVVAAREILDRVQVQKALFLERGYSPWGEVFDLCIAREIDVLQWIGSHRDNALLLKRYNSSNAEQHPAALSAQTWKIAQDLPWSKTHARRLEDELRGLYERGEWFAQAGTQFDKRLVSREQLVADLQLDPRRKTAVIYAHMFWDATFFYGRDLFHDYYQWFVAAAQAAIRNPRLNWIIKVHPANTVKSTRDGYRGLPSEMEAIARLGQLPEHVKVMPAESPISTFSLFGLTDYCLTVRGTVGIESAAFGARVITAGTGRYDHLGFTLDPGSQDEYLATLARLEQVQPMSRNEHELAQRYAYTLFFLRPLELQALSFGFQHDALASGVSRLNVQSAEALMRSPEMEAFVQWVRDGVQEDFLSAER